MYVLVRDLMNAPQFLPGDYVETEPCAEPQAGEMMIATKDGARILGRCVINERGGFDLVPLRQGYPAFSGEDVELVGVAITHCRNLRPGSLRDLFESGVLRLGERNLALAG